MPVVAVDSSNDNLWRAGKPFIRAALVTPSDTDDLVNVSTGILISVDGVLRVIMQDGSDVTFASGTFLVKTIYPLRVRRVRSTSTTATGIVAFSS